MIFLSDGIAPAALAAIAPLNAANGPIAAILAGPAAGLMELVDSGIPDPDQPGQNIVGGQFIATNTLVWKFPAPLGITVPLGVLKAKLISDLGPQITAALSDEFRVF